MSPRNRAAEFRQKDQIPFVLVRDSLLCSEWVPTDPPPRCVPVSGRRSRYGRRDARIVAAVTPGLDVTLARRSSGSALLVMAQQPCQ